MSAGVELRSLCKFYGNVEAAKDIDLVVEPGEFLTLLGPSGSGKTTTMMCIAGFTEPTSGDILIDGRSIIDLSPHKRSIGIVFQNYALFPHLNVFENVAFPLRERHAPKGEIRERVHRTLELVDLSGHDKRRITQLSGGQQQRVALARSMVFDPPLLLMDEPLSALDKRLRDAMQIELKRIQRRVGVTVIYVTHDQSEALALSDHIAIMDAGRIQQKGTPAEVYNHPVNAFVGSFLGESNLYEAEIVASRGALVEGKTAGGLRFQAPRPDGLGEQATVRLMVRPERISVRRVDGNGADPVLGSGEFDGSLSEGEVLETVYLGDTTRLVVGAGEERVIVRAANRIEAQGWQEGDAVRVGWPTEAGQIVLS